MANGSGRRLRLAGAHGRRSQLAPYSDGYWAYTDAGWTWVSSETGGIVYHYGRWAVEDEGWCWTPDYEWGRLGLLAP
jgi:hypothetical protein